MSNDPFKKVFARLFTENHEVIPADWENMEKLIDEHEKSKKRRFLGWFWPIGVLFLFLPGNYEGNSNLEWSAEKENDLAVEIDATAAAPPEQVSTTSSTPRPAYSKERIAPPKQLNSIVEEKYDQAVAHIRPNAASEKATKPSSKNDLLSMSIKGGTGMDNERVAAARKKQVVEVDVNSLYQHFPAEPRCRDLIQVEQSIKLGAPNASQKTHIELASLFAADLEHPTLFYNGFKLEVVKPFRKLWAFGISAELGSQRTHIQLPTAVGKSYGFGYEYVRNTQIKTNAQMLGASFGIRRALGQKVSVVLELGVQKEIAVTGLQITEVTSNFNRSETESSQMKGMEVSSTLFNNQRVFLEYQILPKWSFRSGAIFSNHPTSNSNDLTSAPRWTFQLNYRIK